MPFARGCGMPGLPNEDFQCKINHFVQPWKYPEARSSHSMKFRQWAESRHWRKPPGCRQGAKSGLKRLTFQRLFQMAVIIFHRRLLNQPGLIRCSHWSAVNDGVPAGEPARLMAVPRNTLSAHLAGAIALDANLPSYQAVSGISGRSEYPSGTNGLCSGRRFATLHRNYHRNAN